jgi:hypothetical protein
MSWQPNTPMHLDSLNILKTIGRIRQQCGVLAIIATFHMQGGTLMQLWNLSIAT